MVSQNIRKVFVAEDLPTYSLPRYRQALGNDICFAASCKAVAPRDVGDSRGRV